MECYRGLGFVLSRVYGMVHEHLLMQQLLVIFILLCYFATTVCRENDRRKCKNEDSIRFASWCARGCTRSQAIVLDIASPSGGYAHVGEKLCVCVCVCVYSLGSFTHPQPPFSIGMSVYTLCGILRMQGAMREIQNVQQREWVQEAAGDRCVVLKSNTNQTLRLSCCTPVSYIHMYIYIYISL